MMPNLEMQVNKTNAGIYTVTYGRKEAPLDVQAAAFAANHLDIISPAQLGFLRAKEGKGTFNPYSRTVADVFYDDRDGTQVVIAPDGAISRSGQVSIADLVDAHRHGKEYVIPKDQRDLVYAMVDEMINKGIAVIANPGQTYVNTSDLVQVELTSNLFSDKSLGINAQDYANWLQSQGREAISFFMDGKDYSQAQKSPYLNKLRVYGPGVDFVVVGNGRVLGNNFGAFGVRFEKTAEGGAKN